MEHPAVGQGDTERNYAAERQAVSREADLLLSRGGRDHVAGLLILPLEPPYLHFATRKERPDVGLSSLRYQ
jgi:hypothetical protein